MGLPLLVKIMKIFSVVKKLSSISSVLSLSTTVKVVVFGGSFLNSCADGR